MIQQKRNKQNDTNLFNKANKNHKTIVFNLLFNNSWS